MRFACQLFSDCTETHTHNIDIDYRDLRTMQFWLDGELFVFVSPDTPVVRYLIQSN